MGIRLDNYNSGQWSTKTLDKPRSKRLGNGVTAVRVQGV